MSRADRCLKVLYQLQEEGQEITTGSVAARLGVQPSSVTEMFQRLAHKGLVRYRAYRGVELTPKGWKRAAEIVRHHRLLELYLYRHLSYPLERVHGEAERLQSAISEEFEERIARLLGDPEYDPHGDPIPRRDGSIPPMVVVPLRSLQLGQEAIIRRVRDTDALVLSKLVRLGVIPWQRCRLCGRKGKGRAYLLALAGEVIYLPETVARAVFVEPL